MVKYEIMVKGKIDVITKYFYPVAGGIEANTHRVYSALVKAGWQVTIHTSRDTLTHKNVLPVHEIINGIKVVRYNYPSDIKGYAPKIDWFSTDVVALHNFNVSHFRILLTVLWLKITDQKKFLLALTPHGGFTPEWRMFTISQRITKCIYHFLAGNILVNICVDFIRAVSEWERREIIKKGIMASKVKVIVNGLEDEAYKNIEKMADKQIKSRIKTYGNYIIQIGRIHPIKNYETVIKSLPLIDRKINFVIAGEIADQKYLESLKKLVYELGVEKRVFFVGVVRGIDKYYLIKRSVAMVHMAIWESFCNVVNEALSQGTICIVADNTALKYLVTKNTGFLIDTMDYKKLAETVNWVFKNPNSQKLKNMSEKGKKIARSMSWEQVAKSFEKEILNFNYEK